jgi:uncharacterized NAD-dependent epimerase/dehydratase family protein
MPRGLILCHQPSREFIGDYHGRQPWVKIPPLSDMIRIYEDAARPVLPTKVLGICLNTFDLDDAAARRSITGAAAETGLPAADPVRFDPAPLADAIARAATEWRRGR